MTESSPKSRFPLSLTLAADSRLAETNYVDDQIWELKHDLGEPPAFSLQTTYGLRATNMRLFPRFGEGHQSVSDPQKFNRFPTINHFYPNYLDAAYSPFDGIDVRAEYWVRSSNLIAGRINLSNNSSQNRKIKFEWVALLTPIEGEYRINPQEIDSVPVLVGNTDGLMPVIFISGGASAVGSPFPALIFKLDLPPGKSRQFTWSQAALSTAEDSFTLAREISSLPWDAEIARLELTNSSQVEIFTGNPDWDYAFELAQKTALSLFLRAKDNSSYASAVKIRRPDFGYSRSGDGKDYGPQWNGLTPLDAYYLTGIILPSEIELAEGILLNFLASKNHEGEIDLKPGLAGQISNRIATPILANLAWRIFQINEDLDFLRSVFPALLDFFMSWFAESHDRDQDGIPEWDHPLQTGFEENPLFSRWRASAHAIEITKSESPALCSFLYQECRVLSQIANLLGEKRALRELNVHKATLREAVEDSWQSKSFSFANWDRDTHTSSNSITLHEMEGPGRIDINLQFDSPVRLVFRMRTKGETTRKSQINIHGISSSGQHRVENISGDRILWFPGWGTSTSDQTFASIEYLEILGIDSEDYVTVTTAGLSSVDITCLLPIWAHIPSDEQVQLILNKTILNVKRFWRKFGLPACMDTSIQDDNRYCNAVHIPFCSLVGEGMLKYGFRDETAEMITRVMNAVTQTLKKEGHFREYYDSVSGNGFGEINELGGLPPLGLFINTLGIQLKSPWKIGLSGYNPFPWPVTIKYRGTTILRGLDKTQIVFPDGQNVTITDSDPKFISMERNEN